MQVIQMDIYIYMSYSIEYQTGRSVTYFNPSIQDAEGKGQELQANLCYIL